MSRLAFIDIVWYNQKKDVVKLKYKVKIEETLIRVVEVDAETEQKAIEEIKDQYRKEKIILGSEDYDSTSFDIIK